MEFNRRGGQRWANAHLLWSAASVAGGTFLFLLLAIGWLSWCRRQWLRHIICCQALVTAWYVVTSACGIVFISWPRSNVALGGVGICVAVAVGCGAVAVSAKSKQQWLKIACF